MEQLKEDGHEMEVYDDEEKRLDELKEQLTQFYNGLWKESANFPIIF